MLTAVLPSSLPSKRHRNLWGSKARTTARSAALVSSTCRPSPLVRHVRWLNASASTQTCYPSTSTIPIYWPQQLDLFTHLVPRKGILRASNRSLSGKDVTLLAHRFIFLPTSGLSFLQDLHIFVINLLNEDTSEARLGSFHRVPLRGGEGNMEPPSRIF